LVLCLVIAAFLFTSAGADEADQAVTFSLQQAVDYALENSAAIKLANTAVDKAEVGYREAKSAYDRAKDAGELPREERMMMGSEMLFESWPKDTTKRWRTWEGPWPRQAGSRPEKR
jgi:hypothetical protein